MANILDMSENNNVLDMSNASSGSVLSMEEEKKKTWLDAMWSGAKIGFMDTARGVQQIAGINEEELAQEQRELNALMEDEEIGWAAKTGYFGGLIADPVGWMLPVSRLKHGAKALDLILPGAIGGATAGALGYVLKTTNKAELIAAIKSVSKGEKYFSTEVTETMLSRFIDSHKSDSDAEEKELTIREIEVLVLISTELTNAEIGEKLFISTRTVDAHRRSLLSKLGARNTAGLVAYAIKNKFLE